MSDPLTKIGHRVHVHVHTRHFLAGKHSWRSATCHATFDHSNFARYDTLYAFAHGVKFLSKRLISFWRRVLANGEARYRVEILVVYKIRKGMY
jgi:hypothetical protein